MKILSFKKIQLLLTNLFNVTHFINSLKKIILLKNLQLCDTKNSFKLNFNCSFLYSIFSGDKGSSTAEFALPKMAADVLLGGQLNEKSDEEIRELMRQSFGAAEKGYLNLIDHLLATKATMQYEIPEGLSQYEISQKYQYTLNRLHAINHELTVGASVVLALIANKKLFIGNLGVCRALLCKTDAQNVLRVIQVSFTSI